jgi:hypothetical protein
MGGGGGGGGSTSTVSASPQAGFSIVTYTGTGVNATVGHGLGVALKMVIIKARSRVDQWRVGHSSLTSWAYYLSMTTDAQALGTAQFNSTAPTSSVFSVGTDPAVNNNTSTYVAYCFAEILGYSKFGSYTGNGSATDGPFIFCGFRPKYVIFKNASAAGSWNIIDAARDTFNTTTKRLLSDTAQNEAAIGAVNIDFTSNGFKVRDTNSGVNGSTNSIIYAAFAENPFGGSNCSPATAR